MARILLVLAVWMLGHSQGWAQSAKSEPPLEEKGTYLGALFAPVPEVLYDHLRSLPRGQGVVLSRILPHSPAVSAKLRRNDILLEYNGKKIYDCEMIARWIHDDLPGRRVRLTLLRRGRKLTTEAVLTLGPALQIAQAKRDPSSGKPDCQWRGIAKPSSPDAVCVTATPLEGNSIAVTIGYYQEGTGRLHEVNCSGTPAEIDNAMQKLPSRVQGLARVALHRIRMLDIQKDNPAWSTPSTQR